MLFRSVKPITAALMARNPDLVHDLIRRGAKINHPLDGDYLATGILGTTPLTAAIQNQDPEMVNFIIREGANLNDPMAIEAAIDDPELHSVRVILFSHLRDTKSEIMLSFALTQALRSYRRSGIVSMLLSFGADPNTLLFSVNSEKQSALGWVDRKSVV